MSIGKLCYYFTCVSGSLCYQLPTIISFKCIPIVISPWLLQQPDFSDLKGHPSYAASSGSSLDHPTALSAKTSAPSSNPKAEEDVPMISTILSRGSSDSEQSEVRGDGTGNSPGLRDAVRREPQISTEESEGGRHEGDISPVASGTDGGWALDGSIASGRTMELCIELPPMPRDPTAVTKVSEHATGSSAPSPLSASTPDGHMSVSSQMDAHGRVFSVESGSELESSMPKQFKFQQTSVSASDKVFLVTPSMASVDTHTCGIAAFKANASSLKGSVSEKSEVVQLQRTQEITSECQNREATCAPLSGPPMTVPGPGAPSRPPSVASVAHAGPSFPSLIADTTNRHQTARLGPAPVVLPNGTTGHASSPLVDAGLLQALDQIPPAPVRRAAITTESPAVRSTSAGGTATSYVQFRTPAGRSTDKYLLHGTYVKSAKTIQSKGVKHHSLRFFMKYHPNILSLFVFKHLPPISPIYRPHSQHPIIISATRKPKRHSRGSFQPIFGSAAAQKGPKSPSGPGRSWGRCGTRCIKFDNKFHSCRRANKQLRRPSFDGTSAPSHHTETTV